MVKCQDWEDSATISIFKGKGDAMKTTNKRLLMLETSFKLFEKIIVTKLLEHVEHKIRQQQRGFLAARSTSDGIFILRQFEEKYRRVKKNLYCIFVDLAKAFGSAPRRVIWWVLEKLLVPEWIVKAIEIMYKSLCGVREQSKPSPITSGVHQGSIPSPILFNIMTEAVQQSIETK